MKIGSTSIKVHKHIALQLQGRVKGAGAAGRVPMLNKLHQLCITHLQILRARLIGQTHAALPHALG